MKNQDNSDKSLSDINKNNDYQSNSMSYNAIARTVKYYYPDIEAIYLFGSFGTDEEKENSDLDIALLFPLPKAKMIKDLIMSDCYYALSEILARTVDIINLRTANTVFQHEIIYEGRIIYMQNEYSVDSFEMLVISLYQKLNDERAGIIQEILKNGKVLQ
jgi:predicted nucleotidyltransferase